MGGAMWVLAYSVVGLVIGFAVVRHYAGPHDDDFVGQGLGVLLVGAAWPFAAVALTMIGVGYLIGRCVQWSRRP